MGRGVGIKIICFFHACCSQDFGWNYILPEGKENGVSFPHNANCRLKSLSRLYSVPIIVTTPQALFFFLLINISCVSFRGTFLKLSYKFVDKEILKKFLPHQVRVWAFIATGYFPLTFNSFLLKRPCTVQPHSLAALPKAPCIFHPHKHSSIFI